MVAIPLKEGMSAKEFWQAAAASSDANQARLPQANTWAMQRHLDETAKHVRPGAHAVMLLDNAGWHRTKKLKWPTNISPLFIAAGCPELNAAENVWQHLRQTYLSNRVFQTYGAVVDAAAKAWNKLLAEAGRIASIATRSWVVRRQ